MNNNALEIFEEPLLEFGHNQKLEDPHDGLALFGPVDLNISSQKPSKIRWGVIGTKKGISFLQEWIKIIQKPILPEAGTQKERIWPPFPGFEAVFHAELPTQPSSAFEVSEEELIKASQENDPYKRAFHVVEKYLDGIEKKIKKKDEPIDVIICVVPDLIYQSCKPKSKISKGWGHRPSQKDIKSYKSGQQFLFDKIDPNIYNLSVDFRRQLKARVMKYNIPIQIMRESTINPNPNDEDRRGLTPLTDRAWNMTTTLYYKVGGKPWKLSTAREGVCYIGMAFKRSGLEKGAKTATCAAQMFLDSGDGIVFVGEEGPWYSQIKKEFHLTEEAAKKLLSGVLNSYRSLEGKDLKEIFIHSRSEVNESEINGYLAACPKDIKLVIIRVRPEKGGLKLFREGIRPVLRGTFLKKNDKTGYLWGSGFKSRLGVYDGWEIPNPLKIDILHGTASIEQVARDIFGLTKLNYNTCKLGDAEPVTVKFSEAVGEILVSNQALKETKSQFKFYI